MVPWDQSKDQVGHLRWVMHKPLPGASGRAGAVSPSDGTRSHQMGQPVVRVMGP